MERDIAINRVLRDMKMSEIICEINSVPISVIPIKSIRPFFEIIWQAGREWRRGTPSKNGKPIVQLDRDEKIIGDFNNVMDASRKLKIPKMTIYHALYEKRLTREGNYFRYVER